MSGKALNVSTSLKLFYKIKSVNKKTCPLFSCLYTLFFFKDKIFLWPLICNPPASVFQVHTGIYYHIKLDKWLREVLKKLQED